MAVDKVHSVPDPASLYMLYFFIFIFQSFIKSLSRTSFAEAVNVYENHFNSLIIAACHIWWSAVVVDAGQLLPFLWVSSMYHLFWVRKDIVSNASFDIWNPSWLKYTKDSYRFNGSASFCPTTCTLAFRFNTQEGPLRHGKVVCSALLDKVKPNFDVLASLSYLIFY